ncbi:MAG: membrane-bound lytic murein transglycosylase MltF, partial [Psychromonas sp.]|nr:membrane-bound lytic murein transglycosylase MltF [Psychromonas sp.]
FTISEKQPVAWLIKRTLDNTLYSAMIEFIGNKYQDQTIAKLQEKYFGHVENFDFVDTKIFLKRIKTILPKYEQLFKKYTTPEVDWSLLAAVSYQESHWNPRAKSPTGVRGMMMLTLDTARYLGIKNRLNAKQSIKGGAKYLSLLINRLPESIADNEKVWFALASYNLGYGHLMDARRITAMRKQDPNSWSDVKENLPLLHEKKWYKKTRYGYARGREAQHYVNNIRQYRKTLTWFIAKRERKAAEEEARQIARDKALAEQKALQTPVNKKEALQQVQEEILAKETALQEAQEKTQDIEDALQQAKEKSTAAEEALQKILQKSLAEQKILAQAKAASRAQQQALQEAQDKAFKEEKLLLENQEKTLLEEQRLQQAKELALTELERLQKARKKALAEQQTYQQAKEKALSKQQRLQKMPDTEQQEKEEKS